MRPASVPLPMAWAIATGHSDRWSSEQAKYLQPQALSQQAGDDHHDQQVERDCAQALPQRAVGPRNGTTKSISRSLA